MSEQRPVPPATAGRPLGGARRVRAGTEPVLAWRRANPSLTASDPFGADLVGVEDTQLAAAAEDIAAGGPAGAM